MIACVLKNMVNKNDIHNANITYLLWATDIVHLCEIQIGATISISGDTIRHKWTQTGFYIFIWRCKLPLKMIIISVVFVLVPFYISAFLKLLKSN